MKVLYNWLKEFVDAAAFEPVSPKDLAARLSSAGVAIDAVEDSAAGPLLDAEITTNRPDLLGHYGVAREAAAILRTTLKPVEPKLKEAAESAESAV
jgi:phenylalanyl-tRNA synthetase beta chain